MHLDWTIQVMPGARDGIIPGDLKSTQDAPGLGHQRSTSGIPDWTIRDGEQQARDWIIRGREGDTATPMIGSSGDAS